MPRPRGASLQRRTLGDGSTTYSALVTVGVEERRRITLGSSRDGMDDQAAQAALERLQAEIVLGKWEDPRNAAPDRAGMTFHVFASEWHAAKALELSENGIAYNLWALKHLLPFFATYVLADIDVRTVDAYRRHKLEERAEIDSRLKSGQRLVDGRGQPLKPLANRSINKTIIVLSEILQTALDQGLIDRNPARGKARRLRVRKKRQTWLMPDQALDFLDAAERIDRRHRPETYERAERLRQLRASGTSLKDAAGMLGIAPTTGCYLSTIKLDVREVSARRAIVATLLLAGLRVTELCTLRWKDIDFANRRLNVRGTKTGAADRWIKITDLLLAELERWKAEGQNHTTDGLVFPSPSGRQRTKDTVREDVTKPTLTEANRLRRAQGHTPIAGPITPHTFRRTFVALRLASGEDVKSVQRQAGHEDARTTLDIYGEVMESELGDTPEQVELLCAYTAASSPPARRPPRPGAAERPVAAPENPVAQRTRPRAAVTFSTSGYSTVASGAHAGGPLPWAQATGR